MVLTGYPAVMRVSAASNIAYTACKMLLEGSVSVDGVGLVGVVRVGVRVVVVVVVLVTEPTTGVSTPHIMDEAEPIEEPATGPDPCGLPGCLLQ